MTEQKTTLLGRRIGRNELLRKQRRARKIKRGFVGVWRWFKRGGWVLGVLLLLLGAIAFNNRFYLQRFNPMELRYLRYVDIEGNRMLSWEDIMQSAQIEEGMLMSEVDVDSVEAALLQRSQIHSVSVQKKFPSSVMIKLQEASPVLTVLSGGKASIYSEKGELLPFSVATAMRLPVLDVASLEKVKAMSKFLVSMRDYSDNLYERVSQLSWSGEGNCIKVFFRDMNFTVLFPVVDENKEPFRLYESLENGFAKDLYCAGEVDLRFNGFAYVRNYDKRCVNG